MAKRYAIPEGKTIRTLDGGTDTLKNILRDLKRYSFSGYVKTISLKTGEPSVGYIVVKEGNPETSVYSVGKAEEYGKPALKKVLEDSYDKECEIELHARVDVDEIVSAYGAKASISGRKAERVKVVDRPKVVLKRKLEAWRNRGFDVSRLETALEGDVSKAKDIFYKFEEDMKKLRVLAEILSSMNTEGFEEDAERIRSMFKNPEKNLAIEAEIERLREKIEEKKDLERWISAEEKIIEEKEIEERASEVAEMLAGAPKPKAEIPYDTLPMMEPHKRDEKTNLIKQFTFERFVVGPSNRFAQAACMAVARTPYKAYNPLFICSGPGLGKTHLLNAIGNYVVEKHPDTKVLYVTAETFINEFGEAKETDGLSEFRKRYRNLDVLLLDDAHFLSGKEDVQEELFHTFNALYNDNKEIALTSDRPPKEITDLEERLVSRFESGLVADIQPPDLDTKMAILLKKAEEVGVVLDEEVLSFIAKIATDNIRELEGALNRVIAYSTLTEVPITADLTKEVLGEAVVAEEIEEEEKVEKAGKKLVTGRSYMIEEDRPQNCFRLFVESIEEGRKGFLITRSNPRRMRERYALGDSKIIWLTDRESGTEETIPPTLERIIYLIEGFAEDVGKGTFLIDGLEYLISNNNFDAVLRFLRRLIDEISESDSIFLLSVSPKTLQERQLKILEKEMEVLDFR